MFKGIYDQDKRRESVSNEQNRKFRYNTPSCKILRCALTARKNRSQHHQTLLSTLFTGATH